MGAHTVEEVTVVAHHQHSILEIIEILLQPSHSVEVKVVGRLVEEEIVGITEKSLGKQHAHLFIGAHVAHKHVVAVFLNTETAQKCCRIALGIPAFEFCEFLLELGGPHAILIVEVGLGIESVLLLHYIPEHGMTAEHCFEHSTVVELEVILLKHTHTLTGALLHRTSRGSELPAEHTHQRRLAGAVSSDYTIAVTGREFEVHILK